MPRQQGTELIGLGFAADDALQNIAQIDEGIVAVEAGGLDQGDEDRPRPRPGLGSGEQRVAATGCNQAMEALDGVGVDLDPAVVEVNNEAFPVIEDIPHGASQRRLSRYPGDLSLDIGLERLDLGFALLLTHPAPFVRGLAADGVLDLVEFGDAADDLGGDRRLGALEDLEEAASRVAPAKRQDDGAGVAAGGQGLEAAPAIDLEHAREGAELRQRAAVLAAVGVDVDHGRGQWAVPRAVVAGIAEQGAFESLALGHHRQVGIVAEEFGRGGQHGGDHQLPQRLQPPGGNAGPVAQGGAVEIDAVAAEDAGLAIERQPVAILGDDDPGQQGLGGHAARDRTLGRRRLDHRLGAGAAAIDRAAGDQEAQAAGDDIELLGDILPDLVHLAAAARAGLVLDIDLALDLLQMGRQVAAIAGRGALGFGPGGGRFDRGRSLGDRGRRCGDILLAAFESQMELLGVHLFRAGTEPGALELTDDMLQPGQFVLGRGQFGIGVIKGRLQGVTSLTKAIAFTLKNADSRRIMKSGIKKRPRPGAIRATVVSNAVGALRHDQDHTDYI